MQDKTLRESLDCYAYCRDIQALKGHCEGDLAISKTNLPIIACCRLEYCTCRYEEEN